MYILPKTLKTEIETFREQVSDFRNNKTEAVKFKAIRVPMGIYEQRKDDTYMVRVRCTGGIISPAQLKGVAQAARQYGSGDIHITTRQELQIHNVKLENTPDLLESLYTLNLSSRGGGGNTVRNIMASENAGIAPDEVFDVTPYFVALTNTLIAEPDSWSLPRKLKIAFSGNDFDNSNALFNDVGFVATKKKGKDGFKVYIGGGTGSAPSTGHLLFDFLLPEDVLYVTEAVKKLFSDHGNRRNRHKARLRYVFYKLGKEKVFELFFEYFNALKQEAGYPLNLPTLNFKIEKGSPADSSKPGTPYAQWYRRYVKEQKQTGLFSVEIPFEHGITNADTLENLSDFLNPLGNDVIRLNMRQNIRLRNIPGNKLYALYGYLTQIGTDTEFPRILNNLVACTGADTCRLGICLSKGESSAIRKELNKSRPEVLDALHDVHINLSGCPNSCGQHLAADLGFYGKASRNDRLYPAYYVTIGGKTGAETAKLGKKAGEINARDLPVFTREILENYTSVRDNYNSFSNYLESEGEQYIQTLLNKYREIPSFEEDKNYYFDWGGQELFSVKGKGKPECSAGMFDMIDFDRDAITSLQEELKNAGQNKKTEGEILNKIVFHASRMLLVTRGIEPKSHTEVFDGFIKHFIDEGYISQHLKTAVELARRNDVDTIRSVRNEIFTLADEVNALYESMDDSLQFKITEKTSGTEKVNAEQNVAKEQEENRHFKDFRGVACPMNFVKTKIELAQLKNGALLEILLDDGAPINNVPGSVEEEGHEIVAVNKKGEHWSVVIRKV
jgi:sulfite reductase (ferredoxin)